MCSDVNSVTTTLSKCCLHHIIPSFIKISECLMQIIYEMLHLLPCQDAILTNLIYCYANRGTFHRHLITVIYYRYW